MLDLSKAVWQKSPHSNLNGCVEVAFINKKVAVRDSKDRSGPVLQFTPVEWETFVKGVHNGEFDFPQSSLAGD